MTKNHEIRYKECCLFDGLVNDYNTNQNWLDLLCRPYLVLQVYLVLIIEQFALIKAYLQYLTFFLLLNSQIVVYTTLNMLNNYRLLYILLYNTGIYLDEYTAWKVILDEPIGESNMTFPAVYESKYISYCTVKCIITFLLYIFRLLWKIIIIWHWNQKPE